MTKKERFYKHIEIFVNETRKEPLELLFGTNAKLEIKNVDYSTTNKLIFMEVKLILGEDIDDFIKESILASDDIIGKFIKDAMDYIIPDSKIALTITYDV
jgi:hypothetical protein